MQWRPENLSHATILRNWSTNKKFIQRTSIHHSLNLTVLLNKAGGNSAFIAPPAVQKFSTSKLFGNKIIEIQFYLILLLKNKIDSFFSRLVNLIDQLIVHT